MLILDSWNERCVCVCVGLWIHGNTSMMYIVNLSSAVCWVLSWIHVSPYEWVFCSYSIEILFNCKLYRKNISFWERLDEVKGDPRSSDIARKLIHLKHVYRVCMFDNNTVAAAAVTTYIYTMVAYNWTHKGFVCCNNC